MNKFIRVFSYILMVLGAVIILGGLGAGVAGLFARGFRMAERAMPMARMMNAGGFGNGLRIMFDGLLVSGFGMLLHQVGEVIRRKDEPTPAVTKTARTK